MLILAVTVGVIFGVYLEPVDNDSEKPQPKNDVVVHPMFKLLWKKALPLSRAMFWLETLCLEM